jgi:hypothetical protein
MRVLRSLFVILAWLCCAAPIGATTTAADGLSAVRAPHPLAADPALDDPAWQAGKIALGPGFENLASRRTAALRTIAYLLFDDRNLYVAFQVEQAGLPIVAGQTTNNVGFGIDDFVGIGIDPGGSGSQVYYFEATPRGTRYQQASENARYAPQWTAAARIAGGSWNAVLIIPLAAMRIHSGPQRWRINLIRGIAASGEHFSWAFDGLMQDGAIGTAWPNFTDVRFWPEMRGMTLAGQPGWRVPKLDVYALGSAGRDRAQFTQADGSVREEKVRNVGLDLSAPLSETVTFVGTLAPDFSNVEVDQQTIAPQEFRRQLTEYRPFFAQGAAFLNPNPVPVGGNIAPQNLIFYSPSIGPFDRGAKIEGTVKNDAFGVLSVRGYDQVAAQTFDDVAFGFKHALPDRTFQYWTDGVLAHHSAMGNDETTEAGVEGRNLKNGFVWLANTSIERGTAIGGVAHSTNGFVDVHKPNYEVNAGYTDVSPHYGPLDGFTATSDIRGPQASLYFAGNGTRTKNWSLFLYGDRYLDGSGAVHEADTLLTLSATFKNQFSINNLGPQTGVLRSYDVPSGPGCAGPALTRSSYSGAPCYLNGRTDRFNLFNTGFGYRDGTPTPIDATFAFGPFGGFDVHQFTLISSRPIAGRFSLALEYDGTYERSHVTGMLDSQWLRRIALAESIGHDSNVAISLRVINGNGGFAVPGSNLAASFHRHYANGNELYLNFGTPAATATLDRVILKYVFHAGGPSGT